MAEMSPVFGVSGYGDRVADETSQVFEETSGFRVLVTEESKAAAEFSVNEMSPGLMFSWNEG